MRRLRCDIPDCRYWSDNNCTADDRPATRMEIGELGARPQGKPDLRLIPRGCGCGKYRSRDL